MSETLKIKEVKSGKKNGIEIERITFSDGKVIYKRLDKNTFFPKNISEKYISLAKEYRFRQQAEDEVTRIMRERGYSREKKNNNGKKIYFLCLVLFAVIIIELVTIKNVNFSDGTEQTVRNDNEKDINISQDLNESKKDISENIEQTAKNNDEKDGNNKSESQDSNELKKDRNVYEEYTDENGVKHYTDGSTFDPHACDKEKEAYDVVHKDVDAFDKAYQDAIHSKPSYEEIYEKAGKNFSLADEMMKKEQAYIDMLLKQYQEQVKISDELYEKWAHCRRVKMYGFSE